MDTRALARLYDADGPFATVYLNTVSNVPDAAQRLELRWKNARKELADGGIDDGTLDAVEEAVGGDHSGGDTLVAVGAGRRVLLRRHLPEPPARDLARAAPLPILGPLLEWQQSQLPHVVVLIDRQGADVLAFPGAPEDDPDVQEVQGGTEHIHRGAPGGWSQRRFQQRAENTWEQNAHEVAEAVTDAVDRSGAALVVVAGDVRAVQFMREALPERVATRLRVLERGARSPGGSIDAIAEEVTRQVATVASEATADVLRTFKEERGQHDRATDGVARTVEALQRAQVETLLVDADPDDDRTAWFGPEAVHVASDRQTLIDLGVDEPAEGPLVEALIRAAVGTGAAVRVVPRAGGPSDGVGAILRHTGTAPETPSPSS